jgi:sugar phosphate isomerase/epimerase
MHLDLTPARKEEDSITALWPFHEDSPPARTFEEDFHMKKLSRRTFICQTLAGTAALGAARNLFAATSEPHMVFPTQPRERLAVASWPFRAYINSPRNPWRDPKQAQMDFKEFPAMVKSKFGLDKIEPLAEHFAATDAATMREFRAALEKAGVKAVDIAVGSRASYYDPNPEGRKAAIASARKWVDIAVEIGSPSIRTHVEGVKGVKPDVDRAAESLKQVADYGARKNVQINLENDDLVTEDAFFLVKVIEKANHPWLHALPDFCNSMLTGNADFNYRAVTAMFKHAYNISHVKDSEVGDKDKLYTVDLGKTFAIAKAAGYRGYYSMEFEGRGSPYEGVQKLIDASLKYLA